MILDLIRCESGEVLSNGVNVAGGEGWKNYTASYLDEGFLIDYLTPEEYFYFIGGLHQQNKAQVDEKLAPYLSFLMARSSKKANTSATCQKVTSVKLA
jgi:ABC-2 type transport system ATP-binding protein